MRQLRKSVYRFELDRDVSLSLHCRWATLTSLMLSVVARVGTDNQSFWMVLVVLHKDARGPKSELVSHFKLSQQPVAFKT